MSNVVVVQAAVDGVVAIAVVKGELVTILTDLADPFAEVAVGRWEGGRLSCSAWLGRDEEHGVMVHAAIEKALANRAPARAGKTLPLFADAAFAAPTEASKTQ